MRRFSLTAAATLLAATLAFPAGAYVIFLKDGGQVVAREKPTIQGAFVVFYTPLGAMQKIKVSEYDEKKTLEMNAKGTGDAYVLGDTPVENVPAPEKKPSLSQYIQQQQKSGIGTERPSVEVAREPRLNEPAVPSLDPGLESRFVHTLETYGVKAPRVTAATGAVQVKGIAETEDQVFGALKGIAKSLTETKENGRPVPKAEIYLSTSTGESAGHFEMTMEDAEALVGGKKTTAAWFMANVIL